MVGKILILLIVLIGGLYAQAQPTDVGVEETIDEFTGARECSHEVYDTREGYGSLGLQKSEVGVIGYINRIVRSADEAVINTDSPSGGSALIILSEKDKSFEFNFVGRYFDRNDRFGLERAVTSFEQPFLNRLLNHENDIRVRLSGSNGTGDFTIDHENLIMLRNGFAKECF